MLLLRWPGAVVACVTLICAHGFAGVPAHAQEMWSSGSIQAPVDPLASVRLVAEATELLDADRTGPEVAEKLQRAYEANPDYPPLYVELARFTMKSYGLSEGALAKSEAYLRHALELDPNFGNGYVLLGYVLTHQDRLTDARDAFASARRLNASNPWLPYNEAEMMQAAGNVDSAVATFRQIAESSSTNWRVRGAALYRLQRYYREQRQIDLADRAFQQGLELAPDSANSAANYSQFLRVEKLDLKGAETWARKAISKGNNGWIRETLSKVLYLKWAEALSAGDKEAARTIFAEANGLYSDYRGMICEVGNYPRPHPIIDVLVSQGVSPDDCHRRGMTPLTQAAAYGTGSVVRQLLRAGASPGHPDNKGLTPLMRAAHGGYLDVVNQLLEAGVGTDALDPSGRDAQQIALDAGNAEVAQRIVAYAGRTVVPAKAPVGEPFTVGYIYRVRESLDNEKGTLGFEAGDEVLYVGRCNNSQYPDMECFRFRWPGSGDVDTAFMVSKGSDVTKRLFEEIGPHTK